MYYKTKRDSETGIKFTAIAKRRKEAYTAAREFIISIDAQDWRSPLWSVWGGVNDFTFTGEIPKWVRKNKEGFFQPNTRTKAGIAMRKQILQLPTVGRGELNECIGYNERLNRIGVTFTNPDFYLIELDEKWDVTMPQDCEEITVGEYKVLSSIKVESNN